jgi:chemotaxis protein CheD
MKKVVDVQIGEIKAERGQSLLQSKALGSCIAVVGYDAAKGVGAMAHIMLPGRAPTNKSPVEKTKYANDAILTLLLRMFRLGSNKEDIKVVLVGGGNVLQREDDTICRDNIESVSGFLKKLDLKVEAQALGGFSRRSVFLNIDEGAVWFTEDNGPARELWKAGLKTV